MSMRYPRTKYKNEKVRIEGQTFDSKREANRYLELRMLERVGAISNLKRQVKYVLIPAQREPTKEIITRGKYRGTYKQGRVIERECAYIADFEYTDKEGNLIVEDCKGVRTEVYKIKRKLMLYKYGISVKET